MAACGPRGLLLFPCNGNAMEALDALGPHDEVLGFVDDDPGKQGRPGPAGLPVLSREAFARFTSASVLAVPGSPASYLRRRQVIEGLGLAPERFATVIHPRACVSRHARVGRNVLLMAGAVVTSNAVVGDHVCILPNTVVHHDVQVGDWSLVGAGVTVSGGTRIGENCYIGSGASLIHGIVVGDGALVGLGANVLRDVAPRARVAGNPARALSNPHSPAP